MVTVPEIESSGFLVAPWEPMSAFASTSAIMISEITSHLVIPLEVGSLNRV